MSGDGRLRAQVEDAAAREGHHERRHLQAEPVRFAGQRGEDDQRTGGTLLQGQAERAEHVTQALGEEVLVAYLEPALLPGLADLAQERGDHRLQERERPEARRRAEERMGEPIGCRTTRPGAGVSGDFAAGRGERRGDGRRRRVRTARSCCRSGSEARHHLPRAMAAGQGFRDPPQPRDDRERVYAVARRPALRDGKPVTVLPCPQRLDRDAGGARERADGQPRAPSSPGSAQAWLRSISSLGLGSRYTWPRRYPTDWRRTWCRSRVRGTSSGIISRR